MSYSSRRPSLICHACGSKMRRVHRHADERGVLMPAALRRYRCRNLTCAWEGLVDRQAAEAGNRVGLPVKWPPNIITEQAAATGNALPSNSPAAPLAADSVSPLTIETTQSQHATKLPTNLTTKRTTKRTAAIGFLPRRVRKAAVSLSLLSIGAMAATVMHFWPEDVDPHWPRTARGQLIALGESYDGDDLVESHALNQPALAVPEAAAPEALPSSAPAALPVKKATAPALALRQRCTWGQPGRSPYKGTVEEALRTAHVPESVVQKVAARVRAKDTNGRLVINNKSIRLVGSKRQFSSANVTMTYGRTLCVETKVHFKKGHSELADLYDATDDNGKRYSVMVPDVCGNVSVLAAAEDAGDDATLQAAAHSAAALPEPSTWAGVLIGLLGLALFRRRP